jgi:hypothetical protein
MIEMLEDGVLQALQEAEAYAEEHGATESLERALSRLERWGGDKLSQRNMFRVQLYKDFAPYSFGFAIFRRGDERAMIVGGLIFHPARLGADTSGSVELAPSAEPHWSLHT